MKILYGNKYKGVELHERDTNGNVEGKWRVYYDVTFTCKPSEREVVIKHINDIEEKTEMSVDALTGGTKLNTLCHLSLTQDWSK